MGLVNSTYFYALYSYACLSIAVLMNNREGMLKIDKRIVLIVVGILLFIGYNQLELTQAEEVDQVIEESEESAEIDDNIDESLPDEENEISTIELEETPKAEQDEGIEEVEIPTDVDEITLKDETGPVEESDSNLGEETLAEKDLSKEELTDYSEFSEESINEKVSLGEALDEADSVDEVLELGEAEEPSGLNVSPMMGLIDVGLLGNTKLAATHTTTSEGKEKIKLNYEGQSLLNLGLLTSSYVIFQLPFEISAAMDEQSIVASYDVPEVLFRRVGEFGPADITVSGNQVILNSQNILTLSLLSIYKFSLEFTLDELPPTEDGEYRFRAEATKQVVDLSILTGNVATDTLDAPQIPRVLEFHSIPEILQFQDSKIDAKPMTIQRENPNWEIKVNDTRGEDSAWKITAEVDKPLTSIDNPSHTLPDGLVYVAADDSETSLSEDAVVVFNGSTGITPITSVNWAANRGLLLKVRPFEAYAETYSTTITWTLMDAP